MNDHTGMDLDELIGVMNVKAYNMGKAFAAGNDDLADQLSAEVSSMEAELKRRFATRN
ncbi:hypothetical protein [Brevibacterium moorei]|uniref:hypothetical protein n=1 Tax=Brevibacterium moorei TaxID=2968457 RepID=UPI00211C89E9|nr:hypothetical protein [Brevibacterium sp. 68QC2CO]MCQ9384405.1 hypothetical protein [Brevibacterium sp. 68QC2CO]